MYTINRANYRLNLALFRSLQFQTHLAFLLDCTTTHQFPLNQGWKTACFDLHFLGLRLPSFHMFVVYLHFLHAELTFQNGQPVLIQRGKTMWQTPQILLEKLKYQAFAQRSVANCPLLTPPILPIFALSASEQNLLELSYPPLPTVPKTLHMSPVRHTSFKQLMTCTVGLSGCPQMATTITSNFPF